MKVQTAETQFCSHHILIRPVHNFKSGGGGGGEGGLQIWGEGSSALKVELILYSHVAQFWCPQGEYPACAR